jgi:hypothetical protein
MNKRYLILISLVAVLILAGGLLTGCGNQPTDQAATTDQATAPENTVPEQTPPAEVTTTPPAPEITESDLDKELNDLDKSWDTVKTTGFEPNNLNDKDLGL